MIKSTYPLFFLLLVLFNLTGNAQATLEKEVKITDLAMYFDGNRVDLNTTTNSTTGFDYVYGAALTPHGDCVKVYDKYVFLTWYRGGKMDRHVMLSRYNTETGVTKTIEFPHQHTGYNGRWWIGETHNTIAVGVCPKDGTIHMVYDMHRNGRIAAFANDYLRYSYSTANAATVPDSQFNINLFVQSPNNNYKHLRFPGITDDNTTKLLTYPAFFTNDEGDLFMKNRFGFSENGKFLFAKYDGNTWEGYTDFNRTGARDHESDYNWGLYGDFKYLNGKLRIGFQQRANVRNDKYQYQNGFYYAYSDDQSGKNQWKDHAGNGFNRPMSNSNLIKVSEPGDLVEGTDVNSISMVGGFDWTVTDNEDVHLIARVKDNQNNKTVHVHTYKPAGATNFITTTNFGGAEALYSSGGNVYIIGLSGGRPFVEEAKGGTNAFTRVYEATSGKRFRKGQVYISNGKLYYYLLENNPNDNDDTQPTYLQIIDLKIGKQPFSVSLTSPNDGDTFETEDVISVNAIATTDVGEISKVEFLIDGNSFQEDTTQPYAVNWTATSIGEHTVQAIAYDTNGETLSSTINTIAVTAIDKTDLTGDVYTLRNMQTGLYLTSNGSLVTANDVREGDDRKWTFVKTTSDSVTYYNIDSETDRGILRATGGGNGTPFAIVNTGKGAPATDVDKIWTVHYNEADDTYRFEARNQNRFLYHHEDGDFYNLEADSTDPRSKWQVVSSNVTLSIADVDKSIETPAIKIYPNPTSNNFTVKMLGNNAVESIEIYNILGRKVYANTPKNNMLQVDNAGFVSGVYLVKAISKNNKSFHARLVVK